MTATESTTRSLSGRSPSDDRLLGGLPLFLLAAALLVESYLSNAGLILRTLGRVELWPLLLLAGLVAAAGGVVAYLFTGEASPSLETVSGPPSPVPAARPTRAAGRARPRAESRAGAVEVWRETGPGLTATTRPYPPAEFVHDADRRLGIARAEIEAIYEELDAIERDTSSRRKRTRPSPR